MSLLATPTGHLANLSAPPPVPRCGGRACCAAVPVGIGPLGAAGLPARGEPLRRTAGTVRIEAFDQSDFAYDPVTLSLGPGQARHFNSTDLEVGNADKGLSGSTGAGRGDWRLELASDLDIEVLAYIRTKDGFVTSMHDLAPAAADGLLHRVAFFNPGSNYRQASHLRLVNRGVAEAEATVEGIDDAGQSPGSDGAGAGAGGRRPCPWAQMSLRRAATASRAPWATARGKWRLWVTSDQPLLVASLLDTPTGHLANLSTAPGRGAARPSGSGRRGRGVPHPGLADRAVEVRQLPRRGRRASGNTRLVFVTDADADHLSKNLSAFRSLLESVNEATGDGADYVLGKIQGVSHGGGVQVAAGHRRVRQHGAVPGSSGGRRLRPVRRRHARNAVRRGDGWSRRAAH